MNRKDNIINLETLKESMGDEAFDEALKEAKEDLDKILNETNKRSIKMTKEEKRAINRLKAEWRNLYDNYALECYKEFSVDDAKDYQKLMASSYKAIKAEWNNEFVSKELACLLYTMGAFGHAFHYDGNSLKGDLYEKICLFHDAFMDDLLSNDDIPLNEEGLYEWEFGEPVDLETFDILSGLEDYYD